MKISTAIQKVRAFASDLPARYAHLDTALDRVLTHAARGRWTPVYVVGAFVLGIWICRIL